MAEPTTKGLWKIKVVILLLCLVMLGLYVFKVVPFMIRGWTEFMTLLGFHVGTYLLVRYVVCELVYRWTSHRLLKGALLYLLVLVAAIGAMALYSHLVGGLQWQGWETLYIENFWEVVLTFFVPMVLGTLFFVCRRHIILEVQHERDRRTFDHHMGEAKVNLFKLDQQRLPAHTLFNTLTIIAYLSRENPEGARLAIARLGEIMRFYLRYQGETYIGLQQEREQLAKLVEIYKMRFGDSTTLVLQIDESLPPDTRIPPGLLVNLAENMAKHGLLTDPVRQATVQVVQLTDDILYIKSGNAIAHPDAPEDKGRRGQLTRLVGTIQFLHPKNKVRIRKEGDVFHVEIWLHGTFY